MRMMLVGAGAVGESILKVMQWRDPKGEWLKYVLVCDYDLKRAEEVVGMLKGDSRFEASKIDATNTEEMAEMIREHKIDFVMDAAPPFASNMIFDAAFKTGADYGSMGTWSVPMEDPAYGLGIENSYTEPMTKYNFDRHEAWKKQGNMAVICMGIDPGVVNVFAKYAATELLDEITEVHVKDGGNLSVPGADPDDIMFGFNVWTVLDEVMNPNVEYDKEKGGFIVEKAYLYLRKEAVSQEVIDELLKDQIEVKDYFDIYEDIKNINGKVLLDTKSVNYTLVNSINIDNVIDQTNPSQLLKSIKNDTEIKATKDAHLHDGIAVTKFMYWLKTNIGKIEMDELSISNKLLEFRKQQPNFKDISFTTICAYRENAALMHYHPTEKQYSKVEASHLLLIDSGGQYLTGTTDITRTFVLGEMTQAERKDFTIALKAMFRLQNAHFIEGVTTGANLDILARGVIYDYDLDYRCGTGHGVGHFLNVHEGPNGLRPKSLYGHEACIVPGMITTNEPGVYVEGSHGIRHENELLCVKHTENEYGTFLKFEPITYVPFDIAGLDLDYLSNHEIASINEYQQYAFDHIKDALTQEEKDWYLNNLFIK